MHVLTVNVNLPGIRSKLAADQFQQRGFACAAGSHDGGDFATLNIQANIVENFSGTSGKGQIFDGYDIIFGACAVSHVAESWDLFSFKSGYFL